MMIFSKEVAQSLQVLRCIVNLSPSVLHQEAPNRGVTLSSYGSMLSISDSIADLKGDYDISGEVRVKVEYKKDQLLIHVDSARGLAAADSTGYSDP